jgi:autophagy-related protein 2
MDQEASRMLSESTLFSHKDADSIYMSATSDLLRPEANHDGHTDELDQHNEEEVENNEVDERLDRLLSGHRPPLTTPETATADAPDPLKGPRLVKKECLTLDRITVFFPSMSKAQETEEEEEPVVHNSNEPHMPGAFSLYESMPPVKPVAKPSVSPPTPPSKIKFFDPKTEPMGSVFGQSDAPTTGDIEMLVGNVKGTVDLLSEKILGYMLEVVQKAIQEGNEATKRKPFARPQSGKKKTVQVISNEMDIKMIQRLPGIYLDTGDEIAGDDTIRIRCLLNDVNIYRKPQSDDSSTSKVEVRKLGLSDEEEGIITFVPPIPPSTKMSRRRALASTTLARPECAITIVFSQKGPKSWINIRTLPIKLHFDLKRLEEAFSAFGGVGSVLASTTASTATITKTRSPMPTSDVPQSANRGGNIKVDAKLGGLIVDVVGPQRESPGSAEIRLRETKMEFASKPSQDDLSQMLSVLAPSKDRFDDDDILVDTLIRQREQGSVLRISIGRAEGHILDLKVFDRFKEIGDEVVKVLTVTDFVAGDERPGLLTLLNIDTIAADVQCGGGVGLIGAQMERTAITHVSAPALFACAVGGLGVHRNHSDELLGEGLERGVLPSADQDRPMLMVRMIGEELEPVIKVKLWNVRAEYDVETLMAIMDAPENATGEVLAQEIVESIVQLPTMPPPKRDEDTAVLGIDVVVKDSILALNPLGLKSKGLIILTDSRLQAALPSGGSLSAGMEIKKASIMVVDDAEHLLPPEPIEARGRDILSGHLAGLASMGYVPVITISSARAQLQVVETRVKGEKAVDLDISDDLLVIESCADSTQTLLTIVNGLKPPLPETDEVKYCTEVMPVDMFKSMTEDAFIPQNRGKAKEFEPDDMTDFIYDDIPQNLSFVESFYGHPEPGPSGVDHGMLSDSMLEEDLAHITHMPPKRSGSWSKEQVEMLDDGELLFIENYFGTKAQKRKGQRSLNEAAANAAEYFPLRVRVRDVHIIWNLFDGYDWQRTRDTISHAVKKVETKAAERKERRSRRVSFDIDDDEESVVDDFLFNSIYIGVNTKGDPEELAGKINKLHFDDLMSETSYATTAESSRPMSSRSRTTSAEHSSSRRKNLKLSRSRHHKMQFELKGVNVDFLLFPPNVRDTQTSVDVRVRDLEIFDNVPTSTWRKFVTYMRDAGGREMGSSMVHIELLTVKPVPELAASELVLKVCVSLIIIMSCVMPC